MREISRAVGKKLLVKNNPNLSSYLKLKEACETEIQMNSDDTKRTMKAIYGVETYHSLIDTTTDPKVTTKKTKEHDETGNVKVDDRRSHQKFHLLLLAKNNKGYSNLVKIASHAGLNSYKGIKTFYRTDTPFLLEHGEGIICTTACIGGYIPELLLNGEYEKAKETALLYNKSFEHFYLELQANEIPEQLIVNKQLLKLSEETGIDIVITCDVHYVDAEDRKSHDILYKIANDRGKKEEEEKDVKGIPDFVHLKTPIEVEEYCIKYNIPLRAMDNTVKIANMCDVDFSLKDDKFYMPKYNVPDGYTEETYLEKLCYDKFYGNIIKKGIVDNLQARFKRLRYELDVINGSGFAGYFLIVSDFCNKCREKGILVGPGRGSAAGAIVSYILGITNIDPIKHNFLFSRFMNPERVSLPD